MEKVTNNEAHIPGKPSLYHGNNTTPKKEAKYKPRIETIPNNRSIMKVKYNTAQLPFKTLSIMAKAFSCSSTKLNNS